MTTIALEKPAAKLTKAQESLVKNAFAVLAHSDSSKAKRQEALGVLERLGVKADMAKPDAGAKAVIAGAVAKAEAKRNAKPTGPSLKDDAKVTETVAQTGELSKEFREGDDDLPGGACHVDEPEITQEAEASEPAKPELKPVRHDEMIAALAIIARATKQQAEALRKAAAERKKSAPEGEKVKAAKPLTEAQIKKAAELAEKAETYGVLCMAAKSFVGAGLASSKKMQTALNALPLPALRWLAKQYEGVAIPKDKRSKIDIAEFLRDELLVWKAPVKA